MSSKVEIVNLALSHLAHSEEVADFDNDESATAQAARTYYEPIRLAMLRDFPWNFAKKIKALAVQETDPNKLWAFSYRLPGDCVAVRRVVSGERVDTEETRIPFEVGEDDAGGLLFTDEEEAEIEYTFDQKKTERFSADFIVAFSHRLAWLMAPRVTGGDPNKLGPMNFQAYNLANLRAQGMSANEGQQDPPPDAEMIEARD